MKKFKLFVIALTYFGPITLNSQTTIKSGYEDCRGIKNRSSTICDSVQRRYEDPDSESDFDYKYERDMYNIVCADPTKESKAVIIRKIHNYWFDNIDDFFCDNGSFNVPKGNIIKTAVSSDFYPFINKIISEWKIPLNTIDKGDNRTVLDYVKNELDKNKGTPSEGYLKGYYDRLRKAGAKHKSELTKEELARNGKPDGHKECAADAPCKL